MWRRLLNWLLLQMDFTVWQDHAMGPGGFHPVAFKIGTLQLLRKNLNGNRATNCRWTLRYDKIMLWVRVVRGAWICASYHPLTLKKGTCIFLQKPLIAIELPSRAKCTNLTCSPNLTFTLYCSNAVPPPCTVTSCTLLPVTAGLVVRVFCLLFIFFEGFLIPLCPGH